MLQTIQKTLTLEEFLQLPETKPASEYIDGQIIQKPMCTFRGRSIVTDIAVFEWSKIPRDENGEVANIFLMSPDWRIEILSPDQNQTKVTRNILHCLKYGTQIGWLIDPSEKAIFVYHCQQQTEVFEES